MPSIVINNVVAAPAVYTPAPVYPPTPVYAISGPNHGLHLILTFFTCGFWLPIWVVIAAVNHRTVRTVTPDRREFVSAHPVLVACGSIFSFLIIVAFWKVALTLAVIGLIFWGIVAAIQQTQRQTARRRQADAALAARADMQHHAVMRGDVQAGTFGQFQPADFNPAPPRTPNTWGPSNSTWPSF